MDEILICNDYKAAANKNKQIGILADLNDVKPAVITEILSRHGLIAGTPTAKKRITAKVDWSVMDAEVSKLAKEGLKATEIAERLGITAQAIYDRRSFLGGNKKSRRAAEKQVQNQKPNEKQREKGVTKVITKVITLPESERKVTENGEKIHYGESKVTDVVSKSADYNAIRKAVLLLKGSGFVVEVANVNIDRGSFTIIGKEDHENE